GGLLGASSVYGENGAGGLCLRLVEFLGAVPALILVGILRLADPSGGVLGLVATLTLLRTLEVAQLVRAHVLMLLPSDFVEASRAAARDQRAARRLHPRRRRGGARLDGARAAEPRAVLGGRAGRAGRRRARRAPRARHREHRLDLRCPVRAGDLARTTPAPVA